MAAERLTEAQRSLLGWIDRRDDNGRGVRYLPQNHGTPRVMVNLLAKGAVEIGKSRTGKLAWRITPADRLALKED